MRALIVVTDDGLAGSLAMTAAATGIRVVQVIDRMSGALDRASRSRPDVAIVDMDLADGPTGGTLALALHARLDVRSVLLSGAPDRVPPEIRAVCLGVLDRTAPAQAIVSALAGGGTTIDPALVEEIWDRR